MIETVGVVRPDIFRYLDYRDFLRDFFQHLLAKNRKYSQRWIAQKAGWKSPQLISMILKGDRKLSIESAQLLSLALGLSEREEEYLLILVELEHATHQAKQIEILERIRFQFQNGLFMDLPDAGFEYIKKWFYPAVRELCAVTSFSVTRERVAEALSISFEEAEEALVMLEAKGFIRKNLSGNFERSESSIKAADHVSPLIMLQYHLQILERAFQAVHLRREFRHFDSLVVALPHKDVETVRDKIRQFVRELDMLGEGAGRRDDVFQLNIQFFSLTGGRAREVMK